MTASVSIPNPLDHLIDVALGHAEPLPDEVERRSMRRGEFEGLLAFVQWTPSGGKSITTVVRCKNISSNGICIVSSYMLHPEREGVLLVQRSNGEHVLLGVRVVYCRYAGNMIHESGVTVIRTPKSFSLDDFRDEHGALPKLETAA